jgi:hypothetical protein
MFWAVQYDPDRCHAQISFCKEARFHISGDEAPLRPIMAVTTGNKGSGGQQWPGIGLKVQRASGFHQ